MQGVAENVKTKDNAAGVAATGGARTRRRGLRVQHRSSTSRMKYGHRRNPSGYARCCCRSSTTRSLLLLAALGPADLLMITADHGNDPTYRGTDCTREYVPVLAYGRGVSLGRDLVWTRATFADLGRTVCAFFARADRKHSSGSPSSLRRTDGRFVDTIRTAAGRRLRSTLLQLRRVRLGGQRRVAVGSTARRRDAHGDLPAHRMTKAEKVALLTLGMRSHPARSGLERARWRAGRQALDRRRGRQGLAAARPARRRVRRPGADDLRARARPQRRDARQARVCSAGFRTDLSLDRFRELVGTLGYALIGQTADIAPADSRLYALRDVTATVECIPLPLASILSTKSLRGIDAARARREVGHRRVHAHLRGHDGARAARGRRARRRWPSVGGVSDMNHPHRRRRRRHLHQRRPDYLYEAFFGKQKRGRHHRLHPAPRPCSTRARSPLAAAREPKPSLARQGAAPRSASDRRGRRRPARRRRRVAPAEAPADAKQRLAEI